MSPSVPPKTTPTIAKKSPTTSLTSVASQAKLRNVSLVNLPGTCKKITPQKERFNSRPLLKETNAFHSFTTLVMIQSDHQTSSSGSGKSLVTVEFGPRFHHQKKRSPAELSGSAFFLWGEGREDVFIYFHMD